MDNLTTLEKAEVFSCDLEGRISTGQRFSVQFNPAAISINEPVGDDAYLQEEEPRKPRGRAMFGKRPALHFSTKLFCNTLFGMDAPAGDVRQQIRKFYYFFNDGEQKTGLGDRKLIGFAWSTLQVYGILSSMNVTYTMFGADGTPVRAEIDIGIDGSYCGSLGKATVANELDNGFQKLQMARDLLERSARLTGAAAGWRDCAVEAGLANPRLLTRKDGRL